MDIKVEKALKYGSWGYIILALFSFFYGGIYTEMIVEGLEMTIGNLIYSILGALFVGIIGFVIVFVISLVFLTIFKKGK